MTFTVPNTISYHMSGKFIAESDSWVHYTRKLDDYELMLVTKGILYIANEKNQFTVKEGEYIFMSPTDFQHGFKESRCSFYWLHVRYKNECNEEKDTRIESQNVQTIEIPQKAKLPSAERVIVLLKQLQDSDRRYENEKFNSFLAAAILTEIELQTKNTGNIQKEKSHPQEHLIEDIKDFINWNLQRNLKVSDIADYFGYNEKYLTTLFKTISGIAIKQYILQLKMEKAKITLSDTNQQISEIAYSLGFDDVHNFSNAFKKITGLSPTEYKLNYGKEKINREK